MGRQCRLPVGDWGCFADLSFFHPDMRRFVVFPLKVGEAEPKHADKPAFYLATRRTVVPVSSIACFCRQGLHSLRVTHIHEGMTGKWHSP